MLRLSDEFQREGADKLEHSPPKAYTAAYIVNKAEDNNTTTDETAKV